MMMDQQDPNNGAGDWWSQQPPPPNTGTAPPWITGATPQGIDWTTFNGGNAKDPQGNMWSWNGSQWVQQAAAPKDPLVDPNPVVNPNPGNSGYAPTSVPQGLPDTGFGAKPPVYASDPNAPTYTPLPTYVPPTWTGGDYQNPTLQDLQNSPGYASGLAADQMARERSAAAQGTILNGGTQKALGREAQNYALQGYQTLRNNTFEAYKQKYSQFQDAAGMDLNARTLNANNNQNTFQNNLTTYNGKNARTLTDFLTNLGATRNAENDFWGRLQDLNQTGSSLAGGSR